MNDKNAFLFQPVRTECLLIRSLFFFPSPERRVATAGSACLGAGEWVFVGHLARGMGGRVLVMKPGTQ